MKKSIIKKESSPKNIALIKAVLLFSAFLAMLNETAMNVALSGFTEIFNVSVSTVQWLTTGFMLVTTIIVPITAFIIQRFTTRQLFFSSMFLLIIGSLTGGSAQIFGVLLIGRLIQAAGSSILLNLLINTMLVLTPPYKRGTAMGLVSLVILFAPAISPTLSGLIIQTFSWRWLFLGLIPLFIFISILSYFVLKNVTETIKGKVDWLSVFLSIIAFGGILDGITNIGDASSNLINKTLPLLIGAVGLGFFVWRQLSIKNPLLELRILKKYPIFTLGTLINVFSLMTVFAIIILIPMYLEKALGLTTFITGLIMLPGGILNGLASPVVGRIYDKTGPRPLIIPGIILMIIFSWLFSIITASTGITLIIVLHCCILISAAMVMTPAQTNSLNQLSSQYYSHGTAIMNTMGQLAGGLGTAVYICLMSINQQHYLQNISNITKNIQENAVVYGFNQAFRFGAFLLIIALIISLFIKHPISAKENCDKNIQQSDL